MARAARQPLDLSKQIVADRIEERPETAGLRWTLVLTVFMRLLALLWIVKGLTSWAAILGVWPTAGFEGRSMGIQATIIYFAVIDFVAAVGLWMASTWGLAERPTFTGLGLAVARLAPGLVARLVDATRLD